MQEANSSLSQQCRLPKYVAGRGFEKRHTSITAVGLCFGRIFAFGCSGKTSAPKCKRPSLPHSIDHMSHDMVDHVPSSVPENSFLAKWFFCEDNEAVMTQEIPLKYQGYSGHTQDTHNGNTKERPRHTQTHQAKPGKHSRTTTKKDQ